MTTVDYKHFSEIEFRVGRVVKAEDIEESDNLIRLTVDFGDKGERTILSGIKKWHKPRDLEGNLYVFVYNLEPKEIFKEQSQGMIMAAEDEKSGKLALVKPEKEISPGTKVH